MQRMDENDMSENPTRPPTLEISPFLIPPIARRQESDMEGWQYLVGSSGFSLTISVACSSFLSQRRQRLTENIIIDIDIFVNCKWVDTRWQQYSTHLHTNSTQNLTINLGRLRAVPRLCELQPGVCLTTEGKVRKRKNTYYVNSDFVVNHAKGARAIVITATIVAGV